MIYSDGDVTHKDDAERLLVRELLRAAAHFGNVPSERLCTQFYSL